MLTSGCWCLASPVAAQEKVESVLLFSWHADWRALDGGSIALSSDSATSVALVRLLAEQRYGAHPHYVTAEPIWTRCWPSTMPRC